MRRRRPGVRQRSLRSCRLLSKLGGVQLGRVLSRVELFADYSGWLPLPPSKMTEWPHSPVHRLSQAEPTW
jgi:hypothetical protein